MAQTGVEQKYTAQEDSLGDAASKVGHKEVFREASKSLRLGQDTSVQVLRALCSSCKPEHRNCTAGSCLPTKSVGRPESPKLESLSGVLLQDFFHVV